MGEAGAQARRRGTRRAACIAQRDACRIVMDEDLTMLIGPAVDGRLLEVGVLDLDGDDPVVIHAMSLRPKVPEVPRMKE